MSPRRAAKRRPVVLYQPREEGAVMPLGLLALGSWLSGEHVVIVDGRFELAPESRVVELARGALCLGVNARTGTGLREALRVSAAARAAKADLAIVWGGPHATLDPASCLDTGIVDACVVGAGEEPLGAAVSALRAGRSLRQVGLLMVRDEEPGPPAPPPTTLWPRADYALLDLERHFETRGGRRLDYCSSRGAREGVACWMGLRAERVVAETRELSERYRVEEVLFQDEDFFADADRVEAIALGMLEGGPLRWQGGARPEDVTALAPERLRLLAESGCLRLHVGVAPGVTRELLVEAGARLHGAGLAARFVFDVKEPHDGTDSLKAAVSLARSLSALDERFETPIRRLSDLRREGATTLDGWAARASAPWSDRRAEHRRARATFFFGEAQRDPGRRLGKRLVRLLALVRVRLGFFGLDLDRLAVEAAAVLRTGRPRHPLQRD